MKEYLIGENVLVNENVEHTGLNLQRIEPPSWKKAVITDVVDTTFNGKQYYVTLLEDARKEMLAVFVNSEDLKKDNQKGDKIKSDWNKVVCQICEKEMYIAENGIVAIELDSNGKPYNICRGDVAMCPECGSRVIARWGQPKHCHEDGFQEEYEAVKDLPNTVVFK